MAQNFAPYQDTAPEFTRTLSPPTSPSPKAPSPRPPPQQSSSARISISPPTSPSYQNGDGYFNPPGQGSSSHGVESGAPRGAFWGSRSGIDLYETSLGIRLDWEACIAYLGLPPAGAVLLLMLEHRSDYVRFHAWQSALLFSVIFIVHVIFSWSPVLSWLIFTGDLFLIGLLTLRAYRDAETLDRFEIPFFGRLASSILDDE